MPNSGLTGSRIRQRRLAQGIKQSHLASHVGISPAYLNLIEHNKRRIGGKLLTDIAEILSVDATMLAEGAEAGLIVSLRDAAALAPDVKIEMDKIEEFAGRFPGWSNLLTTQHKRITDLERTVESLSDRMAHDPTLAASLHDLLSTVTAINATSAILVETDEIEAEWRDRFNRNIFEDSQRLADGAQGLVTYLETVGKQKKPAASPQEQLESWLSTRDFHIPELEGDAPFDIADLLEVAQDVLAPEIAATTEPFLKAYKTDAEILPLAAFSKAAVQCSFDPVVLASMFQTDFASILRRLSALPTPDGTGRFGLVTCDGSGALLFRKPVEGFPLPRLGTACPLWPLYEGLSKPMTPVRAVVEMAGGSAERFLTYAIAQPVGTVAFDMPPVLQATMLIMPADRVRLPEAKVQSVGTSCRICPKPDCIARRDQSILSDIL